MHIIYAFLVVIFQLCELSTFTATEETLIDPSGWNYDRATKDWKSEGNGIDLNAMLSSCMQSLADCQKNKSISDASTVTVFHTEQKLNKDSEENKCDIGFYRRFVNLLLNSAKLSILTDTDFAIGYIEMKVSLEQMKLLESFGVSHSDISLRELDNILSVALHEQHTVFKESEATSFLEVFNQREVWLWIPLIGFIIMVWYIISTTETISRTVKKLVFYVFVCAFFIEFYRMYQEKVAIQKAEFSKIADMPLTCVPEQGFWASIFANPNKDCENYYKTLTIDPIVKVSPVAVLSKIMTDFCVEPTVQVAEAISKFSSIIIGTLPWWYGLIVYAFSSLSIFIIVIIGILLCLGRSIRFGNPFLHMAIDNRAPQQRSSDHLQSEKKKEITSSHHEDHSFVDSDRVCHRNMVEDLRVYNVTTAGYSKDLLSQNADKLLYIKPCRKIGVGTVSKNSRQEVKNVTSREIDVCSQMHFKSHIPNSDLNKSNLDEVSQDKLSTEITSSFPPLLLSHIDDEGRYIFVNPNSVNSTCVNGKNLNCRNVEEDMNVQLVTCAGYSRALLLENKEKELKLEQCEKCDVRAVSKDLQQGIMHVNSTEIEVCKHMKIQSKMCNCPNTDPSKANLDKSSEDKILNIQSETSSKENIEFLGELKKRKNHYND